MKTMTLKDAILVFSRQFPGRKVIGYWKEKDGYILNTKSSITGSEDIVEPGQFVVKFDGSTYGTNPMRSNLDPVTYKRIR